MRVDLSSQDIATLQIRAMNARRMLLTMIYHAGSGHPGGSLSAVDLLVHLYFKTLRFNPEDATDPVRDRFVLSKGHAAPALYAVLAEARCLPWRDQAGFRKRGSALHGHPHVLDLPAAETSTGSLGQGFSVALGMALGLRHAQNPARVYVMLGDGELQEGQVWEAAAFAAHHRLSRLCAILDYNKMQSDDFNAAIMGLEPLCDRWRAFGWHVQEIDGHDFFAIHRGLQAFLNETTRPTIIVAHTIKGQGVSFMQGKPEWHGSLKLSESDLRRALTDLSVKPDDVEGYLLGAVFEAQPPQSPDPGGHP